MSHRVTERSAAAAGRFREDVTLSRAHADSRRSPRAKPRASGTSPRPSTLWPLPEALLQTACRGGCSCSRRTLSASRAHPGRRSAGLATPWTPSARTPAPRRTGIGPRHARLTSGARAAARAACLPSDNVEAFPAAAGVPRSGPLEEPPSRDAWKCAMRPRPTRRQGRGVAEKPAP